MYYKTQLCREFEESGVCEQTKAATKREEESITAALSSLLASNQRIVEDTTVLKAKLEAATLKLQTLKKLVTCHACQQTEKAIYMACGHLLCEECGVQTSCPVCRQPGNALCRVVL